jgi:Mycolic acid cyclopropane synthetase
MPLALEWPGGHAGQAHAPVHLRLRDGRQLRTLALGRIGSIGHAYVRGELVIEGPMKDVMSIAADLAGDPVQAKAPNSWTRLLRLARSRRLHQRHGQRFLDIGAGWGGLLLWAAEHHGVQAHGITLSRDQHAHVQRLIEHRGLQGRVRIRLMDYRDLPTTERFDRIASIGMCEHVGMANRAATSHSCGPCWNRAGCCSNTASRRAACTAPRWARA